MECDSFISAMIGAVVGGSLSLVGTWLANYLQQAAMRRHLQRERMKERIDQIRQYLGSSLSLSELVARLSTYEENDGCLLGTHPVEVLSFDNSNQRRSVSLIPVKSTQRTTSGLSVTIEGPTDGLLLDLSSQP